eukprot:scaffold237597_cov37-Tisochrysis_lutea.AAC.3
MADRSCAAERPSARQALSTDARLAATHSRHWRATSPRPGAEQRVFHSRNWMHTPTSDERSAPSRAEVHLIERLSSPSLSAALPPPPAATCSRRAPLNSCASMRRGAPSRRRRLPGSACPYRL